MEASYVEAISNLGTERNKVPALQHHHAVLFLCWQVLRQIVSKTSMISNS